MTTPDYEAADFALSAGVVAGRPVEAKRVAGDDEVHPLGSTAEVLAIRESELLLRTAAGQHWVSRSDWRPIRHED